MPPVAPCHPTYQTATTYRPRNCAVMRLAISAIAGAVLDAPLESARLSKLITTLPLPCMIKTTLRDTGQE